MKILIVGSHIVEGFATHIRDTFVEMGHDARIYDVTLVSRSPLPGAARVLLSRFVDVGRKRGGWTSRVLIEPLFRAVEESGPFDVVLAVHDYLHPDEVARLKETGAKVALWFPDPVGAIGREYFVAAPYDAVFLKEPYLVAKLRSALGLSAFYLPECHNPRRHAPVDLTPADRAKYGCDVTTVGNLYSYRAGLLAHLHGLDVKLWGGSVPFWLRDWPHRSWGKGGFLAYEEKSKAFCAAKVVVNTLRPGEIWGTNVRTFEIAGSGAFELCEWTPGLPDLFEPGSEIETFRSGPELAEKARRFVKDDPARRRVAAAGLRKAVAEHTYARRLTMLVETLRGEAGGFRLPDIRVEVRPVRGDSA
jgi:spore maturation protein CgeB